MSRERSEGKTGIGGSRRVGSALFKKNIISVEYVKLKLLVALFAAISLSVPHLSHAAPVDELLDVPVRVVGPDGNDVPGAELLFRGDNLGVTSDKWIPAPQTMHLVNRDGFLVNARVLAAGAQRYISDLKIVEGRTVTRDLNTNVVTSDETPGITELLFRFDSDDTLDVPVRVVDADGNDVKGAELLFRGDNLGVASGEWISAPQTMRVANGADLLVNARILDAGLQRLINEIQIVEGRSLTKNLSTNTFTSDATPGTTEILFFFDDFYGMIFSE